MDSDLENLIKVIGCIVVTLILLLIPFILALSISCNWNGLIKLIFIVLALLEVTCLYSVLIDHVD